MGEEGIAAEVETVSGIAVPLGADHGVLVRLVEVPVGLAVVAHGQAVRVGRRAWEAVVDDGVEAEAGADDAE